MGVGTGWYRAALHDLGSRYDGLCVLKVCGVGHDSALARKALIVSVVVNASADSEILTLDEVADSLKAEKKSAYRLTQQGETLEFKLGGTWRFRRSELDRWIAAQITEKMQDKT